MVTTCLSVSISSRTLTNWPGHSCRFLLGNSAFSLTVPVVESTWLSTTLKVPLSTTASLSERNASTLSGPLAKAVLTRLISCCGRLNSTEIGCNCVSVTTPVESEARTMLPSSTRRMPVRPSSGERIVV